MKSKIIFSLLVIAALASCKRDHPSDSAASDSFMPLQVGNYWRANSQNYTEIRDTVRIKGKLFYHLYSLIGGDGVSEDYLRIDENQTLISGSLRYPDFQSIKAKFNANLGDKFQAIGDQSVNDYEITVTEKTANKITFSYDMIYHPNLKGHPFKITYIRGFGWEDSWKEIKINNKVYTK